MGNFTLADRVVRIGREFAAVSDESPTSAQRSKRSGPPRAPGAIDQHRAPPHRRRARAPIHRPRPNVALAGPRRSRPAFRARRARALRQGPASRDRDRGASGRARPLRLRRPRAFRRNRPAPWTNRQRHLRALRRHLPPPVLDGRSPRPTTQIRPAPRHHGYPPPLRRAPHGRPLRLHRPPHPPARDEPGPGAPAHPPRCQAPTTTPHREGRSRPTTAPSADTHMGRPRPARPLGAGPGGDRSPPSSGPRRGETPRPSCNPPPARVGSVSFCNG